MSIDEICKPSHLVIILAVAAQKIIPALIAGIMIGGVFLANGNILRGVLAAAYCPAKAKMLYPHAKPHCGALPFILGLEKDIIYIALSFLNIKTWR